MLNQLIIQGIGFIGFFFVFLTFQFNNHKKILYSKASAETFFSLHLFLLGAWAGAVISFLAIFRNIIFSFRESKKWAQKNVLLYFFLFVFILSGILTWEGPRSILPIIGICIGTFAVWNKNPKILRIIILVATFPWIIYGIIVVSYPIIFANIFAFVCILLGILRYDLRPFIKSNFHNL